MRLQNIMVLAFACALGCDKRPAQIPKPAAPVSPKSCVAASFRLCPTDEAEQEASFAEFRRNLIAAVKKRDERELLRMTDPKIRTTFGEGGGAFKPAWSELEAILALGGSFVPGSDRRSFWAPYVYSKWPEAFDAFEHAAILRSDVVIHEKPSDDARSVTTVDWEVVRLLPASDDGGWKRVRTQSGAEGWVRASDIRSPIGYRAGFVKNDAGAWKLNALVSGD